MEGNYYSDTTSCDCTGIRGIGDGMNIEPTLVGVLVLTVVDIL